jgi:hypothetical protein
MTQSVLIVVFILSLFTGQAACSQETVIDSASKPEIHSTIKTKKEIFSIRHPKMYKTWRKTKKTCVKLTPVVQFGGAVAQILLAFHI